MRPLPPVLALLGLLLAATAWSAPRIPAVAPPASVRAGAEYETAIPDLPAGVEEFELFLLPDDGSGRWIRLTPEREAHDGPLRWRMPRVTASSARLVLRAGGRFGETESAPSAAFAVEPPEPRGNAEVLRADDELAWHFGRREAAGAALAVPPGATSFADGDGAAPAVAPTRDFAPAEPAPAALAMTASEPSAARTTPAPPLSRRPVFVPLRN